MYSTNKLQYNISSSSSKKMPPLNLKEAQKIESLYLILI